MRKLLGDGAIDGGGEGVADGEGQGDGKGDNSNVEIVTRERFFKQLPWPQGNKSTRTEASLLAKREFALNTAHGRSKSQESGDFIRPIYA